ncbi:MAG: 3'-5' exonuclease [Synechococcales bacterium]|nr:3'-5' exonuclease [Synechococcales bacterium]
MNWQSYDFFMVIDLEATCCDRHSIPRNQIETIEIGAVMIDRTSRQPISEFQTFIRPVRHPQLTEFCQTLTSISQAELDRAPTFAEAIVPFQTWLATYPNYLFCSWGAFDLSQIKRDCRYHNLDWKIKSSHCNLRTRFHRLSKKGLLTDINSHPIKTQEKYGLQQALELLGIAIEGTPHRGIDDARNTAKLIPHLFTPDCTDKHPQPK